MHFKVIWKHLAVVAVIAVILPSKDPCAGPGWSSPTLAAGRCTAAPGLVCCVAERSDVAVGSTTWVVTASPSLHSLAGCPYAMRARVEQVFCVLQELTMSAQLISV